MFDVSAGEIIFTRRQSRREHNERDRGLHPVSSSESSLLSSYTLSTAYSLFAPILSLHTPGGCAVGPQRSLLILHAQMTPPTSQTQ